MIGDWGLGIGDWGISDFGLSDCGLWTADCGLPGDEETIAIPLLSDFVLPKPAMLKF
jgi:hypothetical protein